MAGLVQRGEILLTKLLRERLYDGVSLILSTKREGRKGVFSSPSEELSFRIFAAGLSGHAVDSPLPTNNRRLGYSHLRTQITTKSAVSLHPASLPLTLNLTRLAVGPVGSIGAVALRRSLVPGLFVWRASGLSNKGQSNLARSPRRRLKALADAGKITPTTSVRRDDGAWLPASRVQGLFAPTSIDGR